MHLEKILDKGVCKKKIKTTSNYFNLYPFCDFKDEKYAFQLLNYAIRRKLVSSSLIKTTKGIKKGLHK